MFAAARGPRRGEQPWKSKSSDRYVLAEGYDYLPTKARMLQWGQVGSCWTGGDSRPLEVALTLPKTVRNGRLVLYVRAVQGGTR